MHWVRTRFNFGPDYINDNNLRASNLLDLDFSFWLDYINKIAEYGNSEKILYRARRNDEGDWCITDTVFSSKEVYDEYFEYVNGIAIEKAFERSIYEFEKTETTIESLDEVIYERPANQTYVQVVQPGYEHLIFQGFDL